MSWPAPLAAACAPRATMLPRSPKRRGRDKRAWPRRFGDRGARLEAAAPTSHMEADAQVATQHRRGEPLMPTPVRPRRSVLYMPGSNPRALEKARSLPADGLILDLEDAVSPDAKEMARANVAAALSEGGYAPRELILRVNGLDTVWGHSDLAV